MRACQVMLSGRVYPDDDRHPELLPGLEHLVSARRAPPLRAEQTPFPATPCPAPGRTRKPDESHTKRAGGQPPYGSERPAEHPDRVWPDTGPTPRIYVAAGVFAGAATQVSRHSQGQPIGRPIGGRACLWSAGSISSTSSVRLATLTPAASAPPTSSSSSCRTGPRWRCKDAPSPMAGQRAADVCFVGWWRGWSDVQPLACVHRSGPGHRDCGMLPHGGPSGLVNVRTRLQRRNAGDRIR
jgi:hypothetical protein